MRVRSLLLLLVLALITAFTVLNWGVFLSDTPLSFGVTTLHAPLGLIMLGVLVFVVAYCLVYVLYLQTNVLMDTRRNAKELHIQRELSDKAEASRFTELRGLMETGMKQATDQNKAAQQALTARLDAIENSLRTSVEHSSNSLCAYIGELEDRLTPDNKEPAAHR